jgi:hypothetical protein
LYSDKFTQIQELYNTDRKIGAHVEPFFRISESSNDPRHLLQQITDSRETFKGFLASDALLSTPNQCSIPLSPSLSPSSSESNGTESEISESVTSDDTDVESDGDGVRSFFPVSVEIGPALLNADGYLNRNGGWACADSSKGATKRALDLVVKLGGSVLGNKEVARLRAQDNGIGCLIGVALGPILIKLVRDAHH